MSDIDEQSEVAFSSSSESSSEQDSESELDSESNISIHNQVEITKNIEDDLEDGELEDEPEKPANTIPVGEVVSQFLIKSQLVGRVLEFDATLWVGDKYIGRVEDIIGTTDNHYYSSTNKNLNIGDFVEGEPKFKEIKTIPTKGTDASTKNDMELEEELDFSDDEKEMLAKKKRKLKGDYDESQNYKPVERPQQHKFVDTKKRINNNFNNDRTTRDNNPLTAMPSNPQTQQLNPVQSSQILDTNQNILLNLNAALLLQQAMQPNPQLQQIMQLQQILQFQQFSQNMVNTLGNQTPINNSLINMQNMGQNQVAQNMMYGQMNPNLMYQTNPPLYNVNGLAEHQSAPQSSENNEEAQNNALQLLQSLESVIDKNKPK